LLFEVFHHLTVRFHSTDEAGLIKSHRDLWFGLPLIDRSVAGELLGGLAEWVREFNGVVTTVAVRVVAIVLRMVGSVVAVVYLLLRTAQERSSS